MIREKVKETLKNFADNVCCYEDQLYAFASVPTAGKSVLYYDGNRWNGLYNYGLSIMCSTGGFSFVSVKDIAYKKDGKLYEVLTNKEVRVIKVGFNKIEEDVIYAANYINKATSEDLRIFCNLLVNDKENLKSYLSEQKKSMKRSRSR